MAENNPNNVKNFKRRIHINLGTIVFGLVFLYIVCSVLLYLTRNRVAIYEVQTGNIVENQTYTGLALRQEQMFFAESSGNLTYIAHEGTRVSKKSPVYAASDQQSLTELIEDTVVNETGQILSEDDYKTLYNDVSGFVSSFDACHFQDVYLFQSLVNSTVIDALHGAVYADATDAASLGIHMAQDSGILVYAEDGFETVTYETFSPEMLDKAQYKNTDLKGNKTISTGDPVYKLVTDEPWEIIIRLDQLQQEKYVDGEYVEVRFMKDHSTAWAQISKFELDENMYCRLQFTNSMVRFATDRYLDIEVLLETTNGLKVPNSAIVEKSFYTIPVEYLDIDSEANTMGIYIHRTDKKGNVTDVYQEVVPYNITKDKAYLNMDDFKRGTVLSRKGTAELFTIEQKDKLIGVYNVNKGYADFCIVTMLYQNDDYSIVKANESYGLTQYDRIVLDGSSVNDEETIYQ